MRQIAIGAVSVSSSGFQWEIIIPTEIVAGCYEDSIKLFELLDRITVAMNTPVIEKGYDVKGFNLIEPKNSDGYNPFVYIQKDEFANVDLLDNFERILATMRSRRISVSIIIQNLPPTRYRL